MPETPSPSAGPPAFAGVHFWVSDMAASVAFYRMLGFAIAEGSETAPFVRVNVSDSVTFEFGTHLLTGGYHAGFAPPVGRGATCLQFHLESRAAVDTLYQRLTFAGYASHLAPIDAFWGARYAEVLDPDGNAIGFHSPRSEPHSEPPTPP